MAKSNSTKSGHSNFLHLGEVIHNMEHGVVAAYDWLSGPGSTEKDRVQHKLDETRATRRSDGFGF